MLLLALLIVSFLNYMLDEISYVNLGFTSASSYATVSFLAKSFDRYTLSQLLLSICVFICNVLASIFKNLTNRDATSAFLSEKQCSSVRYMFIVL